MKAWILASASYINLQTQKQYVISKCSLLLMRNDILMHIDMNFCYSCLQAAGCVVWLLAKQENSKTGCWLLMTQRKSCDNPGTNIKYKTILVLLLDFCYELCIYSDTKDILLPPFLQGCAIRVQDFSHGSLHPKISMYSLQITIWYESTMNIWFQNSNLIVIFLLKM